MMCISKASGEDRLIPNFSFDSIDGGKIYLDDFDGKVVLVTNTASKCGFTRQYKGLQKLYEAYKDKGLIVFGIPSADFRQEYKTAEAVKNFCDVNFGINFPMTEVTKIIGQNAHPFYAWLAKEWNFTPRWNFNKILIDKNGKIVNTYGSMVKPNSEKLMNQIAAVLE